MEDRTAQLLLAEFRAFRDTEFREFKDDVATWKQDSEGRLSSLEQQVKVGVTGNGQPSRLQLLERSVEQLSQFRYWLLGFAGAISAIFHYLVPGGRH